MKVCKSKMTSDTIAEEHNQRWQAAFNSDGGITLRGYNTQSPTIGGLEDTILVLNENEVVAIFDLFKTFTKFVTDDCLPF